MPPTLNPNAPILGDYRDWSQGGIYGPTGEQAPQERAGQPGQYDYWETDAADVNAYLQAHQNDPEIRAAAQRGQLDHELHARGYRVPEHYKAGVDQGGRIIVEEQSWWDKHGHWALPSLMVGGAIAGGALLGAGGAGGSSGGAVSAGGAAGGIGETAAVAGLGGSGFGTGGGLGLTAVGAGSGAASPILGSTVAGQSMSTLPAGGSSVLGSNSGTWASRILGGNGAGGANRWQQAGSIIGKAAGNHAAGQREDERLDISRDQTALNSYESGLRAPQTRLQTSSRASQLKNWSPVKYEWGGPGSVARGQQPRYTGGYNNPDLIDPRTRELADDIIAQQLEQQMAGGGVNRGGPPPLTPQRGGRARDNILGALGTGASLYGTIFGR